MKHAALAAILATALTGCIYSHREHSMSPPAEQKERVEVKVVRKREHVSVAKVAPALKVTLSRAIESALGKVDGQALSATIEVENGKPLIEVQILSGGKIWEVEIDGTTGAVIEVEQEDDDDDDDDEDDDDMDEDDD
jgi:uncharacterized membrane protein YkoI